MKKAKKNDKINQTDRPKKKRIIKNIVLIILLIIIIVASSFIYSIFRNTNKNNKITAIKTISEDGQNKTIEYTIKIKDYEIINIEKGISFDTKEEAQFEYGKYQIINKFERKEIQAQVKKKKVILTMTEEQFKEDIQYEKEYKVMITTKEGEKKEVLDQSFLIKFLREQGYEIK